MLPGDERDDLRRLGSGHFSDDDMNFSSENPEVERPDQHEERWLRFKDYRISCWGLGYICLEYLDNTKLIEI